MTDEKIKEEFEKWFRKMDATEEERSFSASVGCKSHDIGFYAGFRAAERLAKIEVLEEVLDTLNNREFIDTAREDVQSMLSNLKAGQ